LDHYSSNKRVFYSDISQIIVSTFHGRYISDKDRRSIRIEEQPIIDRRLIPSNDGYPVQPVIPIKWKTLLSMIGGFLSVNKKHQ